MSKVQYESEIVFPIIGCVGADTIVEAIRELGAPVIVARFEGADVHEAQERLEKLNLILRRERLSVEFPEVKRKYLR